MATPSTSTKGASSSPKKAAPRLGSEPAIPADAAQTLRAKAGFSSRTMLALGGVNYYFDQNKNSRAPLFSPQHFATANGVLHTVNGAIVRENEAITKFNYTKLVEARHEGDRISNELRDIERSRKIPLMPQYDELPPELIAVAILHTHTVITICPSSSSTNPDMDVLAVYDDRKESVTYGTYQTNGKLIRRIIRQFNSSLSDREIERTVTILSDTAPRHPRATNPNYVAVNNGVFDFGTKQLHDFDPSFIFLTKSPVNYVENPSNPVITHPDDGTVWDVESWMTDIAGSNDPADNREGMSELLWEIVSAVVRPYVSWNQSAWLYSEVGNNGKGTLLQMMRNLVGEGNYASIPLADFSQDFLLEPLVNATSILVDENDVGEYLEKSANLKAVITNDIITINRKYRAPIAWQHYGFMVQCLNDKPKLRDKSESFFRRQCFVPFSKSYTGVERKYIKRDYINRDDVLQYVLHRVLHMNHYELSTPMASVMALNEYKRDVDPARDFWFEFRDQFVWDLLPTPFLYDLYRSWNDKVNPNHKPMSQRKFIRDLFTIVRSVDGDDWDVADKPIRHNTKITSAEPLSIQYELSDWLRDVSPSAKNYAQPVIPNDTCRGLVRL